jgi:hypothetical protein
MTAVRMLNPTRLCFIESIFNFALEYAIMKAKENEDGVELNGIHQHFVYIDHYLSDSGVNIIRRNTDHVLVY